MTGRPILRNSRKTNSLLRATVPMSLAYLGPPAAAFAITRRILRWTGWIAATLVALFIILLIVANVALNTDRVPEGAVQKAITSKDGTIIAYEQTGKGPAVILVAAALADRGGTRGLAGYLAERFTVINYDRRGRGKSTDTQPYSVEREIEDINGFVHASGGQTYIFGSSSGAVL